MASCCLPLVCCCLAMSGTSSSLLVLGAGAPLAWTALTAAAAGPVTAAPPAAAGGLLGAAGLRAADGEPGGFSGLVGEPTCCCCCCCCWWSAAAAAAAVACSRCFADGAGIAGLLPCPSRAAAAEAGARPVATLGALPCRSSLLRLRGTLLPACCACRAGAAGSCCCCRCGAVCCCRCASDARRCFPSPSFHSLPKNKVYKTERLVVGMAESTPLQATASIQRPGKQVHRR